MEFEFIWSESLRYGVTAQNRIAKIRSPNVQVQENKFPTWEEIDSLDWVKYNNHICFLALHGLLWGEAAALEEEIKTEMS